MADALIMICPMWGTCLPPMGPAYIAAYLEKRGISCDILDLNIILYSDANTKHKGLWKMENFHLWAREDAFESIRRVFFKEMDSWTQVVHEKKYSTIGFSITGANVLFSIEIAKRLKAKQPKTHIVFGGPSCNFLHGDVRMPFRFLMSSINGEPLIGKDLVDYVVLGEGEEAFFEIVMANQKGASLNRAGVIPGDVRNLDMIQRPSFIKELDSLPLPAWGKLPLEKYDEQNELPVLFSRGCINRCAFCNDWNMWDGKFRCRSAKGVFEEIKHVRDIFGKKAFRCNDLLFNGNLKMLDELADLLVDSGTCVYWTGQGVVRTDMKLELLAKLRKAGLTTIIYGLESLADPVLKKMGKPFTFEDIRTVLKRTKEAGINVWINLITGFPGETEEDFKLTQKHLEEIRDYVDVVSTLNPCNITASTELEMFPERFGVVFPAGHERSEGWVTQDGTNSFAVRKRRAGELYALMKQLRIKANFVGIYDGDSPLQHEPNSLKKDMSRKMPPSSFFWRRALCSPTVIFLLSYHLLLATYLYLAKRLRRIIVFPGS